MESISSVVPFDNFKIDLIFPDTEQQVRVVGSVDAPWWVAADVCKVLDLAKVDRSVARLDDDEKGTHSVSTLGGLQKMTVINESGLYALILTSRKPEAKRFRKWLTQEVLPSLRKFGQYPPPPDEFREAAALTQNAKTMYEVALRQQEHQFRLQENERKTAIAQDVAQKAKCLAQAGIEMQIGCHDYMAILGFCSLTHTTLDAKDAAKHGKALSQICRDKQLEIKKTKHQAYGTVNTYPTRVMEDYFGVMLPEWLND